MDTVDLTKYNTSARICGYVYNLLKNCIFEQNILDIDILCKTGNEEITKQCNMVYKKSTRKGSAFPICISLNNCIGNSTIENRHINLNDIVKIKLAVDIDGCIAIYCDTFIYSQTQQTNEQTNVEQLEKQNTIKFLHNLKKDILKEMHSGNTNDEVKIMIESKCTNNNCFPLPNLKSYQHFDDQIYNENGKYIVLNYKRMYDLKTDYLIMENECFEFLENEIYTIEISVVSENNLESLKIITDDDNSKLHRFNDQFYSFKLKTAKQFYSTVFNKYNYNVFNMNEYLNDSKHKLGAKECKNMKVLDTFLTQYAFNNKNPVSVYSIAFTVCIRKDNSALMLKYN